MFDDLAKLTQTATQRIFVRSALNPMLWLCGIVTPLFIWASILLKDFPFLRNSFAIMAVIPVLVTCAGFIFFAVCKPDKLQSEEYQIRHETLQLIQQKTGTLVIDAT